MPRMPPAGVLKICSPGGRVDAGQRDIGAEPIDEQRAEREPDALLELLGLGEGAEVEIGCQLFGCRAIDRSCGARAALHGVRGPPQAAIGAAFDLAGAALGSAVAPQRACSVLPLAARWRLASAARIFTEPPAFSIASTADFEAPATSKVDLRLDSPLPRASRRPARGASAPAFDQRLGVDRGLGVELAGVDRLLDAAEIDLVELDAKACCGSRASAGADAAASGRLRSP